MTRPRKSTVDYYPHACNHGKTMFVLEEQWGNDGYAFWFKLLELLGQSEGHVYDAGNPAAWRYLTAKTRVNGETAADILQCLADLEAIDPELWSEKLIWSQNFVDGIKDAYKKRVEDIPMRSDIRHRKPLSEGISGDEKPQSKLKESKVKESKVLNTLSTELPVDRPNGFKIDSLAKIWNEKAPPELARVNLPFKRNPQKLKPLSAMIGLYPDETWWSDLIAKIYHSSFLRGKNNRGWKATFDFVVSKADEINDGKYIDLGGANQTEQTINTAYGWAKRREAQRNESA